MKGSALLFMLFSWTVVTSLCTFCFTRLFIAPKSPNEQRRKKEGAKA
jgi:hypothetical protein